MDKTYRVVKQDIQPFDNWKTVTVYFLQILKGEIWITFNASSFLADIKHACNDSGNPATMQAYQDFLRGAK